MQNLLKSTTSLTLCFALALPGGAFAQAQGPKCGSVKEQADYPCYLNDGTEVADKKELRKIRKARGEARQEAEENGEEVSQDALSDATAEALEAEANANAEAQAEADAQAAEQQAEAQAQAEADAQAAAEAQAEADAAAAELQAEADAAAAEQQAEAEAAAAKAQAQADAEAQAEAEAATAAALQAEADAAKSAEQQAEADAEAKAEADAEAATEAALQAEADAAKAAEQQAEADAQAQAEADAEAKAEADAEAKLSAEEKATRKAERQAARLAAREEERAAAAAAAESAEGEVVTEEVTEEAVRSSDEEFATSVTSNAAEAQAEAKKDDGGLSKFEKALLLGLGAVAVGAVLKNGDKVISNSGDRVVVQDPDGQLRVLKDDDALIRRPGDEVRTETFNDGSTRTTVNKPDGSKIVTIRGRDGTVLRRINVDTQGREYVLFDDTRVEQEIVVNQLPQIQQSNALVGNQDEEALRVALQRSLPDEQSRRFSLRQVREVQQVRAMAPQLELDAVRFETGSAAIQPEQARSLARIGTALSDLVKNDPRTVILVEGHTDAVGDATYNLALSDRRAETVALALTEYFDVPPENMVTQGYGEGALKVPSQTAEPANRRAVVRNITELLR